MRRRDLIVANIAAVLVLLFVVLIGWWQEAAFGLAVLLVLDLVVWLRERQARSGGDGGGDRVEAVAGSSQPNEEREQPAPGQDAEP